MNGFFIHTFELYRMITYEEYKQLKEKLDCFPDKRENSYNLYSFISTLYTKQGITIRFRQCNENEKKRNKSFLTHKLILQINPSRLVEEGTYKNRIYDYKNFKCAVELLNMRIGILFEQILLDISSLNDFKLGRIDYTKDIKGIPEHVIQQFILLMRRKLLHKGYELNTELEKNCMGFQKENSYNVINKSRGIEFVLYNKHQASIDQQYPENIQKFYEDTIRMELRCSRKYIKKNTDGDDIERDLHYLYKTMQVNVNEIYEAMFQESTKCCFGAPHFVEKMICKNQGKKEKKIEKMRNLLRYFLKNTDRNTVDEKLFVSDKVYENIVKAFSGMELSVVTIIDSNIAFIQSPDSLLEFSPVREQEEKYYMQAKKYTRGKEVFLYV